MKKISNWLLLALILAFALVIYIYKLDKIPSGVYVDEAAVSYNAISILKTGKDEYGMNFPVLFRLFGSYTPPLFIYISALVFKFLSSGIIITRFLSVISALASIVIFYLLLKHLSILKNKSSLLITTFFYAICPWLVFNARLGYETTFAYTLFLLGIYFSYLALKDPGKLIIGIPVLALSTYAAHTQKYLFLIYVFFYFLIFGRGFFNSENRKTMIFAISLTLLVFIPYFFVILKPAFWVKNLSFFAPQAKDMIDNILLQTLSYYSPKSIFFRLPDIDLQHTIPELSIMYNWMIFPYFAGLLLLFKNSKKSANKFIIFLFFVTVIPAVLSGRFISIQRALQFLIPLMLVIGWGLDFLVGSLGKLSKYGILLFLAGYSLLSLYRGYFVLFRHERAEAWNWGLDQVSLYINNHPDKNFIIDNSRNPRLYIEPLYFLNYPPEKYHTEVDPVYKNNYYEAIPQNYEYKFGGVEVRNIDWGPDACKNQIIIGDNLSVSDAQKKDHYLEEIYRINDFWDKPVFIFYRTGNKPGC